MFFIHSNLVQNLIEKYIKEEKYPYLYCQDFDIGSRVIYYGKDDNETKKHFIDEIEERIFSFERPYRPLLIGGGYYDTLENIKKNTILFRRKKLEECTVDNWNLDDD